MFIRANELWLHPDISIRSIPFMNCMLGLDWTKTDATMNNPFRCSRTPASWDQPNNILEEESVRWGNHIVVPDET